jgi:prophage antirepressor-like protein
MEVVDELLFTYTGTKLVIIIDNKNKSWFNSVQICKILKYANTKQAIRNLVDKKYVKKLKDIIDDYKIYLYAQPNTKYLNEYGLYSLLLRSHKKRAQRFFEWIIEDVIPSIRQKGYYKLINKHLDEVKKLNQRIKVLENNQSTRHVKSYGQYIYILVLPTNNPIDYNDSNEVLKIGKTKRYDPRMNTHNTVTKDNVLILYRVKVSNATAVENCLKGLLNHEVYRSNREHYKISLAEAIKVINRSIKLTLWVILGKRRTKTKKISEDKYYKTMNMSEEKQRRNIKFMAGGEINEEGSEIIDEYNKI